MQERPGPELFLPSIPGTLDFSSIFARPAPIEIDLGCGDGAYLVQIARAAPGHNFLGIERLIGRVHSACFKVGQLPQMNARVVRVDTRIALRQLLSPASVNKFHIMFPDPWPKRRHHSRRLIDREFLELISRALAQNGIVNIATDDGNYFAAITSAIAQNPHLFRIDPAGDDSSAPASTFEKRYRAKGLPIYRLRLCKLIPER